MTWRMKRFVLLLALLAVAAIGFLEVSERRGSNLRRYLLAEEARGETLDVATVALEVDRAPEVNRRWMTELIRRIVRDHPDVDLIHFGEASLGWFYDPEDTEAYQREIAEPIPGLTTLAISGLAADYGIFVSFGMTEAEGDRLFNSQVLVGPDGSVLAVQRKKNLRSSTFTPGLTPVTFVDIGPARVALVVCFDINAEETRRLVRKESPDLILLSNADWTEPWDRIGFGQRYQARRYRNWIISANRFGVEGDISWDGHIEVVSPFGDLVASGSDKEQYLFVRLPLNPDPSRLRDAASTTYATISFPYFVLRHAHTAFGYLTEGSPWKAWLILGIAGTVALVSRSNHPGSGG